jgi:hypothetical protein
MVKMQNQLMKSCDSAEHTIVALTSTVGAMLHDSGLPKFLIQHGDGCTQPNPDESARWLPDEVVYGVKPDVSHLHAFGAPCVIVKSKRRLKKLDDRMTMCFFVGYRVWDPKRRVVVESRPRVL